ncbi:ankyrin repeat domain-containing protein [Georgenia sp. SYP-B2076]|uniref:ankyrin repeat domain-containing protein n=1 Tax=Georgenia sp. SYP-B2076 TaxID=2495881 RepID=UPI000F8EB35E|nr:ankyrin repeat domain-containing protein [Georgenia sp. SYP-B2076]
MTDQPEETGQPETGRPDDAALAYAERLFDLAREGATAELAAGIDAGVPVNLTNSKGDTLLTLAAYHQQADTVRALLERGADVHRLNDRGQSALVCAVFQQDEGITSMLLEAGADPDAGTPSPMQAAQMFNLPRMAVLLEASRRS